MSKNQFKTQAEIFRYLIDNPESKIKHCAGDIVFMQKNGTLSGDDRGDFSCPDRWSKYSEPRCEYQWLYKTKIDHSWQITCSYFESKEEFYKLTGMTGELQYLQAFEDSKREVAP